MKTRDALIAGLMFVLVLFCAVFADAETVDLTIDGETYEIDIPDNMEDLTTVYLRAMEAYIGEYNDLEDLKIAFDEFQDTTESTLKTKDDLIAAQKKTIALKDTRIAQLEADKLDTFSFIPSGYYSFSEDGHGFGLGIGVLLFDRLFAQAQAGYPWEARLSLGWKF